MTVTTRIMKLESQEREEVIAGFARLAEERFAAEPQTRSLLFAVAQYWNDQADDETHRYVVASPRETPVWPHTCADYDETGAAVEGERCSHCDYQNLRAPYIGVAAWEPWCFEGSHQSMDYGEAYQPVAIARRGPEGTTVEWIGRVQRPEHGHAMFAAVPDDEGDARRWSSDARAGELFAQVCAHPDDDGPRAVIADYLLEQRANDPRGELIALSLSARLDDAARERRDALVASLGRRWFAPIESICPADSIRYERGFVSRVAVYATAGSRARGSAAWGTVRVLRYLPGSHDVLGPALVALRDVAVVGGEGIRAIVDAPRPWAIERLHADPGDRLGRTAGWLAAATTLPALRELVLSCDQDDPHVEPDALLARLRGAPFWRQLRRITFAMRGDSADSLARWMHRHAACGAPWLAVCDANSETEDGVSGYEVALGPAGAVEVRVVGPSARATRPRLAELARELAAVEHRRVTLVSSARRTFDESDAAHLREHAGIEVTVA